MSDYQSFKALVLVNLVLFVGASDFSYASNAMPANNERERESNFVQKSFYS